MMDCAALSTKEIEEHMRIGYAARLAICEFELTRVEYPKECKGLEIRGSVGGGPAKKQLMKCIKKLEEKPQYWTTLSNNIQSAVALCNASRAEIEKGNITS